MSLLGKFWQLINKDVTGREEVLEATDVYFGKVIYFGGEGKGAYWEAEQKQHESEETFSVIIPAGKDASLEPYARLAARLVEDMDGLFQRSQDAFAAEWPRWCKGPFPERWQDAFILDGITLPENANEYREWSVCYFVEPARRYFTAVYHDNKVWEVVVDG